MGISSAIVSAAIAAILNLGHPPSEDFSTRELSCMTEAVFFETADRPKHEKQAVANVIMNRWRSSKFPGDICSITYQKGQFSFQRPGKNKFVTKQQGDNIAESAEVALEALSGRLLDNTKGSLYFLNPAIAANLAWTGKLKRQKIIGPHHFFR
ncbi:conserved hypothetical protein [Delftia phage PhiW-14]|uniref:Cell wall hydrolase SleB domain-containing protein n=1 Tax=Delftia phage PhiW-14 TaxID=665032 RepID=C9DFZ4_BPW14|nr:endolysin [Delftia phage PhiW-14]ACV50045.1 conserved hypothetical protein [Delftia phage PhiW-14]